MEFVDLTRAQVASIRKNEEVLPVANGGDGEDEQQGAGKTITR